MKDNNFNKKLYEEQVKEANEIYDNPELLSKIGDKRKIDDIFIY